MRAMGWTPDQGIGRRIIGPAEPIESSGGQTGKERLGLRKRRQKRAKKDITSAIVAGEVVYGIREGIYFIVHKLDVKGRPSLRARVEQAGSDRDQGW